MWWTGAPERGLTPSPRDDKAVLLVEADGAGVVGVDVQIEARGREPLGFGDERRGDAEPPCFRRDHDLIEIEACSDRR